MIGRRTPATRVPNSRLRLGDVFSVGSSGLRTRKMRTALSANAILPGLSSILR